MSYTHLSKDERNVIGALKKEKYSLSAIARHLGRDPSTISREIRRNNRSMDGSYRPSHADSNYNARKRRARRGSRFDLGEWKMIEELIREDFSPEQVSGKLKLDGKLSISHETIYLYIWEDRKNHGSLHTHLRCHHKQRRKRYGKYDSRGRLAGKTMINERPQQANDRSEIGHWEIDTVHGKGKEGIVTIVDRKTGYVMIGQINARTVAETNSRTKKLISRCKEHFLTVTSDNGSEFHGYKKIEKSCDLKFYFAWPYHSWERGTNENTNGLIRQYLPKGCSMADLTQVECNAIARKLNNRPRKRHGYRTPNELFNASSNVALHS
jgi:IS30 family transposase